MNIPIVQGVAVDNKYQAAPSEAVTPTQNLRANPIRQFQDVIWAVLFVIHLIIMVGVIGSGISRGGGGEGGGADISSFTGIIMFAGATGVAAVGLAVSALGAMKKFAEPLVKAALIFSVGFSLLMGVAGFMIGQMMMGIMGLISFVIGCCYARAVWSRIPFAAVNLKTALTAVQANMGLTVLSLFLTVLAFIWTILWLLGVNDALSTANNPIIFLLFLSYYWVHQVLQNSMHVTAAGVVGTWWWVPIEASSFCSRALYDSLTRTFSYSFGSICLGSFLVAIIQALRSLEHHTRNSDQDGAQILACIIQCILGCIQGIIEFINRWAYVYVGLYGFSYLDAGRSVVEMFRAKGFTAIITDDLGDNVLFMVSIAIGLLTGLVGLVLAFMDATVFASLGVESSTSAVGIGFAIGLVIGFVFSSVVLSVVGSAVNTVVVCYVEDPAAFQRNHPELSDEMRAAWSAGWPSQ